MKKTLLSLIMGIGIVLFLFTGNASIKDDGAPQKDRLPSYNDQSVQQKPAKQEAKDVYTCTMHPAVMMDKPGKCPDCGMNLVKKEPAAVSYTCPMHPEVVSDKAGKCPKCGMNLEKKDIILASYTCPMHPEVTSEKAGKCPKCGMNLEKKAAKKEEPKK